MDNNSTWAAKSTLIFENEVSLTCSLLISGITDKPDPGLWPSPWWWWYKCSKYSHEMNCPLIYKVWQRESTWSICGTISKIVCIWVFANTTVNIYIIIVQNECKQVSIQYTVLTVIFITEVLKDYILTFIVRVCLCANELLQQLRTVLMRWGTSDMKKRGRFSGLYTLTVL